MEINYLSNKWIVPKDNPTITTDYHLYFTNIKSDKLRNQIKKFFFHELQTGKRTFGTLYRYSYAINKHFGNFLNANNIYIDYFDELTGEIIDCYILYLNNTIKSSSTRISVYSALKSLIQEGIFLENEHYPKRQIFHESTDRMFKHEDNLKTDELSLDVMEQIQSAINCEPDIYIKTILAIAKETGLRLSEILILKRNCIIYDFFNNPILFTYSFKNKKDRTIPISNKVAQLINELLKYTENLKRCEQEYLFLFEHKGQAKLYTQGKARYSLGCFINNHKITDSNGAPVKANFHIFRHSLGSSMLNNGIDPLDVMNMLGHESLHSTSLYAKLRDSTLDKDYRKIGFVGVVTKEIIDESGNNGEKVIKGTLPDGICKKAYEGENMCKSFNKCLLCSKFITTPQYLGIHKHHLDKIRKDVVQYMDEMNICNIEKVKRIESALITIIEQLEALK